MTTSHDPTVVIVPGLRGHVDDHWQTHLAAGLGRTVRTVQPLETTPLSRKARVAALDAVLAEVEGPVVLVAHSAGVLSTVHWAQEPTREIQGALLMTPADMEEPMPSPHPTLEELDQGGWLPIPRRVLPFPSLLGISTDDPLARYRRVTGMAEVWGSRLVDLGAVGHLNPAAGFGPWPRAEELLAELIESTADRQTASSGASAAIR
ncbi:RBBP9/YdeN family alpha/beta hydrolase [Tomitella fengzijianii]|uniref:Alpha/beta hydrolase n=1 Tax=Tomitella fengzijianii TaxID=2597660 RepID=A0A516X2M1_9ACTN|nr:alpha/beta fold hydrolase [Tomitella fengzijianii]QDQ97339.1 alpha/beta hydrolase [Tomitella fengzijianii]